MYFLRLAMDDTNLQEPDSFLAEALSRIDLPRGAKALDLACGRGRHSLELARRGFEVEAWDRNAEALAELERHAAAANLTVATRELDCEAPPAAGPFELVLVFNYLDRALPPKLLPITSRGAFLIYSTFTQDRVGEHPSDRWCLERGELQRGFEGWEVLHSVEANGRAGILARR